MVRAQRDPRRIRRERQRNLASGRMQMSTTTNVDAGYEERFGIRLYKEYFNFGSAHFLIFADGSREELHGHNYRATLEIDAELDEAWLVADFLVVKPIFRGVCDSLDHISAIQLLRRVVGRLLLGLGLHILERLGHADD